MALRLLSWGQMNTALDNRPADSLTAKDTKQMALDAVQFVQARKSQVVK